jgi:hypothetical protein
MKNILKLFLPLVVVVALVGCNTEDEAYKLKKTGNASVRVRVVHPTLGDGPNFLVNYYENQQALIDGVPTQSQTTIDDGFTTFSKLVPTDCFVESYVAGDPRLFDRDTIRLTEGNILDVTLYLKPE